MIATKIIKKHSDYKQLFINIFLVVLIIGVAITIIIIVINSSGPVHVPIPGPGPGPGPEPCDITSYSANGTTPCKQCKQCLHGMVIDSQCTTTTNSTCKNPTPKSCNPGISYNALTGQIPCLPCKPELKCNYGVESKCNTKRNTICKSKPPGPTPGPKPGPSPGPSPGPLPGPSPPAFTPGIPSSYDDSYWRNFTDSKDRLKAGDNFFMRSNYKNYGLLYYKHVRVFAGYELTNDIGNEQLNGTTQGSHIFRFEWKADSVPGKNSTKPGYQGLIYGVDAETSDRAIRCDKTTCSMNTGAEADLKQYLLDSWYSMIITDSDFTAPIVEDNKNKAVILITAWSSPQFPRGSQGNFGYVCMADGGGTWNCTAEEDVTASQIQICFVDNPGNNTSEFASEFTGRF